MRRNNVPSLEDAEGIDLIATCDGVITQIITRKGIPLVHVGDQVKKGDILVSGRLETKNDSRKLSAYNKNILMRMFLQIQYKYIRIKFQGSISKTV